MSSENELIELMPPRGLKKELMSTDYHKYLYDRDKREIIGDFDGAYRNCADTWANQRDIDRIKCRLILQMARSRVGPVRLLDIGCGYGDFVALLRRQGIDAIGCEVSSYAVEQGRERFGPQIQLQVGDIKDGLDFPDNSFDMVLLWGVFWFILDKVDFCLAEVARVLKKDGLFSPSVNIPPDPIGKEIMNSYSDFVEIVRRKFKVIDAAKVYTRSDLSQDKPLESWNHEMVLICEKL